MGMTALICLACKLLCACLQSSKIQQRSIPFDRTQISLIVIIPRGIKYGMFECAMEIRDTFTVLNLLHLLYNPDEEQFHISLE